LKAGFDPALLFVDGVPLPQAVSAKASAVPTATAATAVFLLIC
jgi:hypothetical protein